MKIKMEKGKRLIFFGASAAALAALLALAWLSGHVAGAADVAESAGKKPQRIVSLAPSITEVLFALGLDEEIAGVTDFCDFPEQALAKPRVGGFKGKSLEAIVGLDPDLVIGTKDGNEAYLFPVLDRMGIQTLAVQPSSLTGVIESVRKIGRATGRKDRADRLARELHLRMMEVHAAVKQRPRVRVMVVYGRAPLVLAGPGTFADDMIFWAGGENVAADAINPYPRFSMESVLARKPEVIIEGAMGSERAESLSREAVEFWSRWESLPAVRDNRVAVIDQDLIARPGPRIVQGLEALAKALHPQAFGGGQ